MFNMGYYDGNAFGCSGGAAFNVIMDFGQPDYQQSQYGYNQVFYPYYFTSSTIAVAAAAWYSVGWMNSSCSNRGYLYLNIGTNNYNECPYGDCSIYNAGVNLANAAAQLQSDLQQSNYTGSIDAVAADDMEGGWDCYNNTNAFEMGFQSVAYTGLNDYGDSALSNCLQGSQWTVSQFWQVAYGNGYELPVPEIYVQGQVTDWVNVDRYSWLSFAGGPMTSYPYGFNPSQGFTALWNGLNTAGLTQSMYYLTNI